MSGLPRADARIDNIDLDPSNGRCAAAAWYLAFSFYYFYFCRPGRLPHARCEGNV